MCEGGSTELKANLGNDSVAFGIDIGWVHRIAMLVRCVDVGMLWYFPMRLATNKLLGWR